MFFGEMTILNIPKHDFFNIFTPFLNSIVLNNEYRIGKINNEISFGIQI